MVTTTRQKNARLLNDIRQSPSRPQVADIRDADGDADDVLARIQSKVMVHDRTIGDEQANKVLNCEEIIVDVTECESIPGPKGSTIYIDGDGTHDDKGSCLDCRVEMRVDMVDTWLVRHKGKYRTFVKYAINSPE